MVAWSASKTTPRFSVLVGDGSHLDHVAAVGDGDNEPGVVEVAGGPMLEERGKRFVDAAADSHDMLTRAERYPQQLDGAHHGLISPARSASTTARAVMGVHRPRISTSK
jgi:hypothetical protein